VLLTIYHMSELTINRRDYMRNKATLVYMVLILLISFPALGGNKFANICSDPNEREKVIEQHTKKTFQSTKVKN